jgi:hypothetical protein
VVVSGFVLPLIADGVVLAWWARGGTPDGYLPLVPLLALLGIVGGGLAGGSALGAAWGLRRLADDWRDWEVAFGVVVVREPVPLPNGMRGVTAGPNTAARRRKQWPPALVGEGWYAARPEDLLRMA